MGGLVASIMASPSRVSLAVFITALLPLLGWFSAALIALVTLRHGLQRGLTMLVWGLLPSLFWWQVGSDPSNVIVLLISWCMAAVLHLSTNWSRVLLAGSAVTLLIGLMTPSLMPGLMTIMLDASAVFLEQWQQQGGEAIALDEEGLAQFIVASLATTLFATSIVSLVLARHWQAALYNPGGWREEFHALRFDRSAFLVWGVLLFLSAPLGMNGLLIFLVPVTSIVFVGLGLVHGLIEQRGLGSTWLLLFYVLLFVTLPTLLLVLVMFVMLDSAVDFRSKVQKGPES